MISGRECFEMLSALMCLIVLSPCQNEVVSLLKWRGGMTQQKGNPKAKVNVSHMRHGIIM